MTKHGFSLSFIQCLHLGQSSSKLNFKQCGFSIKILKGGQDITKLYSDSWFGTSRKLKQTAQGIIIQRFGGREAVTEYKQSWRLGHKMRILMHLAMLMNLWPVLNLAGAAGLPTLNSCQRQLQYMYMVSLGTIPQDLAVKCPANDSCHLTCHQCHHRPASTCIQHLHL